jgi:hypothetical protein
MSVHHLPNGREVFLVRWKMVGTYAGVIVGSAKAASQAIRETLPERAAELLPPGHPLAVVGPPKGELPQWMCMAELESRRGVHNTDPDFNSRLYVCWFMADTAKSLDEVIESILPNVDWEELAEDYDIMDF